MTSAIGIIERQAIANLENFGSTLDELLDLYKVTGDKNALDCYNRMVARYQQKTFSGAPASENNVEDAARQDCAPASGNNLDDGNKNLNYFAPMKNLQVLLEMDWFDVVSTNKKKYTVAWRNELIEELMKSAYRHEIAEAWSKEDQRLQIKGHVMGALMAAGVFTKKALAIARIYYGTREENTKEVKTLAKYMGDYRKTYYGDWIIEYVEDSDQSKKE